MNQVIQFLIGVAVLALGFPLGNLLAKMAKDELRKGRVWFRLIILVSLIGTVVGLIIKDDVILFSFAFIAIVTSRSSMK